MKIDVKRSDCKFYIDEANRKVVCVIPDTKNLVKKYLNRLDVADAFFFDWRVDEKLELPHSFSGVATCREDETFDVETGKLIAYNKAKKKLNTSFFKRANFIVNYFDDRLNMLMEELNRYGMRLSLNTDRRENKINTLLGVEKK